MSRLRRESNSPGRGHRSMGRAGPFIAALVFAFLAPLHAQELDRVLASIRASKGLTNETGRLRQFYDEYWIYLMVESPEFATYVGYPGQNHRWSDRSLEAIARRKEDTRRLLETLDTIDRAAIEPTEQLNFDLLRRDFRLQIEGFDFPSEWLPITQMDGVQQDIAQTVAMMPRFTTRDFENILERLKTAPRLIDQNIALLEKGLAEKITPPRVALRDVPQQIRNQIVERVESSPLYAPFTNFPSLVALEDQRRLRAEAAEVIQNRVFPAFRRLHSFFTEKYLPNTRQTIGLSELPNGRAWYAYNARRSTTTGRSAEEIHQIGLAEVGRIRAEMEKVKDATGFKGSLAEFANFLRTDPRFFYTNAADLILGYRDICKRADPELAKLFGKLPRLPYGVLPIPSYAEQSQTTAYYQPGAARFGRAGYFYANTYNLGMRPKWEMEALSLHEAVPGHHLQIALAQELEGLPEFRKHGHYTAFVEGWGLYSESLGTDMGFYRDPYSRFGQLTYEMWRAIRLVVDTGMHAKGWSREKAIEFFKQNAPKAEHDIIVEIDRYIVWPGQALAYKIGELKIKELRRAAESALGPRFDLRAFHDELLGQGAIPLDILEERMKRWIRDQTASQADSE